MLGLIAMFALGFNIGPNLSLADDDPVPRSIGQESSSVSEDVISITLLHPVHFLAQDGSDLTAPPGAYRVEAARAGLRLIPVDGKESLLVEANKGSHEVKVEVPIALSIPGGTEEEADIHVVQLLAPDGSSLEAVGTYSGVRPRGLLDAARNAAAKAKAAAEAARLEAARRAKEAALKAQQLALVAKQAAERQAKIAACKVIVTAVKAGKVVGAFMSQVLPVAKQRRDSMQQRIAQDPAFRERLRAQMKQAVDGNQYAVPELSRITAYVTKPANRPQIDALFSPDVLCGGSMAQFDTKLRQLGLVPNFSNVQPRGVDDQHFYMGIQLTLDAAFVGGAQLGLFGVTDFKGNGGFYFFIGPEAGVIVGGGGVLEVTFFPKVYADSFAGWGGGVGGTIGAVAVGAADVAFDESFSKFQGFGVGGGAGAGSKMVGSLGASYTHAWKL
jgi:hypothetical protein